MVLLRPAPSMTQRVRLAFSRRARHYNDAASLQRAVAWRLARHCRDLPLPEGPMADLGAGTGLLGGALEQQRPGWSLLRLDACAALLEQDARQGRARAASPLAAAPQLLWDLNDGLPAALGGAALLVSSFALHWLDDPAASLRQWCEALAPDGWLGLAVPTAGSFPQWRQAAAAAGVPCTALALPERSRLLAVAASRLELRLATTLRFSQRGPSGRALLRPMGAVGAGSTAAPPLGVGAWRRLEAHWPRDHDGHKHLSWEVLLLIGHQPATELKR
ncbi:methyltransferase [Synechococcus sp. CBW1107]|uniref:methyltransferase n=1 Tax=Synechococcus sp. CBW1107 TaxID=2789857 RepID=UPI001E3E0119|nr:methyltransferase [Synechococcus sp. CBW1107]